MKHSRPFLARRAGDVARRAGVATTREQVAIEEPLEIRLNGEAFAVTMRTPGHDAELALGLAVSEGLVRDLPAVAGVVACDESPNVVDLRIAGEATTGARPAARNTLAYAGCGICGKTTIDQIHVRAPSLAEDTTRVSAALLCRLPDQLRPLQPLFCETGSVHAAGLFDVAGTALCVREDVGRHNALDKVIGWAAVRGRLPLSGCVVLLSGRCGFELAQKAWVAGVPILGSISGPSSLAIEVAQRAGLTLACFIREGELAIFSGAERIYT